MTRVLALTKYGPAAASTRQRLLQFRPALEAAGFDLQVSPMLGDDYVRAIAADRPFPASKLAAAYVRRFRQLADAPSFDLLWVYAELFPRLPAPFERLAALGGKPVIYDCDDAFFHAHEKHTLLRDKLRPLVARAAVVTAGNRYLADHLARWNVRVEILPTVVDTRLYRPAASHNAPPVIGWIGSPSTWSFVRPLIPLIAELCSIGRARFLVVGAGPAADRDRFDGMETREWSEAREIEDVQSMDIGIMPLPDEPWARGKCGYKLIQYMACGLPAVASPVGVNVDIVSHGENGFLVGDAGEWRSALDKLLADASLRVHFGEAGRARVVEHFSLERSAPTIVSLFEEASRRSPAHIAQPTG